MKATWPPPPPTDQSSDLTVCGGHLRALLARLLVGWLLLGSQGLMTSAGLVTNLHEATVQGGVNAQQDIDEALAGYVHVKYSAGLDLSRKAYFQFDLGGLQPSPESAATFTINFAASNRQRVQLWALNQPCPGCNGNLTWNTAPANELNSNDLLTNGLATATRIGATAVIPLSGTTPYSWSLPRLGDYLFEDRITLVLTGGADAANNAGGLRMQRHGATLTFNRLNEDLPPVVSPLNPQTILTNTATVPLPFVVNDDRDAPESLNLFTGSSHSEVIGPGQITLGGSGSNRTVTVTAGAFPGTTQVTIQAVDSQSQTGSTTFAVTVVATNHPPTEATYYQVYLAAGQSNMDGRGAAADLTDTLLPWSQPQADVRIYYVNPINANPTQPTYDTGWQLLQPGWSVAPGFSGPLPSGTFGPELSFGRTLADAHPDSRLAIIKISKGGTSLSSDWNPAGGYMYVTFTNFVRTALAALVAEGGRPILRGMIWHQGESDAASAGSYETRLTSFIAAVRRDLGVTNLPFVVGELATNRSVTIRQAQYNVAQAVPFVGFASSSNLTTLAPDDPHFTAASALLMGQRMAAALESPPLRMSARTSKNAALILSASGLANSPCRLLSATNLTTAPVHWLEVAAGRLDPHGGWHWTNPITPDSLGFFFRLQSP